MRIEVNQFGKNIFSVDIEDFNILEGNPIYIGRSDKCHIHLDDQTLSREHAKIYYEKSELYIESLSSYKKIELNGNEILKTSLSLQDKIIINEYVLRVSDWEYQNNRRQETLGSSGSNEVDENATVILTDELDDADKTEILDAETEKSDLDVDSPEEVSELEVDGESSDSSFESDEVESESFENHIDNEDSSDSNKEESFDEDFSNESFDSEDDGFSDDGFGDDGFGSEGFTEDDGDSTKVFKSFANYSLKLEGSLAPFDRYVVEDNETFIGRNEDKCQIVLNDPEVSGMHAVIKKSFVNLIIEDKDSSNGTLVNGERINKQELKEGDVVTIGDTKLIVEVSSELIQSEQDILMPVDMDQEIEIEEIIEEEVDFGEEGGFGREVVAEKGLKGILKDPAKRNKLFIYAIGLMALWLFLDSGDPKEIDDKAKVTKLKDSKVKKEVKVVKKHSPETLERLEENYTLALAKYEAGEYYEAKEYLDIVYNIDSEYKDVKTLLNLVKEGYEELLRLKAAEEAEKERKKRQLEVKKLMVKTTKAVKDRNIKVAESLFSQVLEIDPENLDIPQLKIEIEAYKAKLQQEKIEKERKLALRKSMVDALAPGKEDYLKQRWYLAIDKLEDFNKKTGMDEDLINDATRMLKDSKVRLDATVSPLLGKARSYKEGQDYKRAYETYGDILKYDPSNEEALNERDEILERLNNNSRKVYREGLISESLSLFAEAKEKFQQVQQISPINSDYYIKATEKLKNYLD